MMTFTTGGYYNGLVGIGLSGLYDRPLHPGTSSSEIKSVSQDTVFIPQWLKNNEESKEKIRKILRTSISSMVSNNTKFGLILVQNFYYLLNYNNLNNTQFASNFKNCLKDWITAINNNNYKDLDKSLKVIDYIIDFYKTNNIEKILKDNIEHVSTNEERQKIKYIISVMEYSLLWNISSTSESEITELIKIIEK